MTSLKNDLLLETDDELLVHSFRMDRVHLYYRCPYCYKLNSGKVVGSKYKKNGEPYKRIKHNVHKHGVGSNYNTGSYHKISHCDFNKKCVRIVVDNNTKRDFD